MKTSIRRALLTGLFLGAATVSNAQTTTQSVGDVPSQLVRVQVEYIDLDHQLLTELMFGEHPTTNDSDLRKKVAELVAQNKATIVETQICTTLSGMKAK